MHNTVHALQLVCNNIEGRTVRWTRSHVLFFKQDPEILQVSVRERATFMQWEAFFDSVSC